MNGRFHPNAGVARLCLPRDAGCRGLISMEDCIELARVGIDSNVI